MLTLKACGTFFTSRSLNSQANASSARDAGSIFEVRARNEVIKLGDPRLHLLEQLNHNAKNQLLRGRRQQPGVDLQGL